MAPVAEHSDAVAPKPLIADYPQLGKALNPVLANVIALTVFGRFDKSVQVVLIVFLKEGRRVIGLLLQCCAAVPLVNGILLIFME
ncbi:hypothetical protein [Eoetvoesiella caeni]|nr:hypothetical protein [Eoetvoesiella caeni]MCI2809338.1 hypothetical protein [Eoetvoesiella caeni]